MLFGPTAFALLWLFDAVTASSQGAQDALILSLLDKIGHGRKQYVEFGFDSSEHCSGGGGSNTCNLATNHGWSGLLMDGGHENPAINLKRELIYSTNIVSLLEKYGVARNVDYLSADVDSADLWVVRAILQAGYRPRLFGVEYNSHFPWSATLTFPDPATMRTNLTGWGRTCAYGATAHAFALAFAEFDYVPVGFVVGLDLFFAPRKLAASTGLPLVELSRVDLEAHFHRPMRAPEARELVDYASWTAEVAAGTSAEVAHAQARRRSREALVSLASKDTHRRPELLACGNASIVGDAASKLLSSKAQQLIAKRDCKLCYHHLTKFNLMHAYK